MEINKSGQNKMLSPYRIRLVINSKGNKSKENPEKSQKEEGNPENHFKNLSKLSMREKQKTTLTITELQQLYGVKDLDTRKFFVQDNSLKKQERHFLKILFEKLQKKRKSQVKELEKGEVYEGYRTINIQNLQPEAYHDEPPIEGKRIWRQKQNHILHYNESCPLSFYSKNGFYNSIIWAYKFHGDLKLTPDDVWLTIMLYFSKYVNDNSKELRSAFVNRSQRVKMTVKVECGDLNEDKNWDDFFQRMLKEIKEKTVPNVTQNLECDFSSTDRFAKIFSTATIMNSFKKIFQYGGFFVGCGIVRVHMGGSLEDWERLQKKLQYLRQFDVDGQMKKYVDRLMPVLGQFTETYKGNAHLQFWNNLYHERKNPYRINYEPASVINGWLIRFFTIEDKIDRNQDAQIEEISVRIKYVNKETQEKKNFSLVGGCKGISIEDRRVFRPHFSYAITEKIKVDEKVQKEWIE